MLTGSTYDQEYKYHVLKHTQYKMAHVIEHNNEKLMNWSIHVIGCKTQSLVCWRH